ncbi:uncharacterized protein LOC120410010 [Corvus cornix cornix]|uniref:uncharacterized protein LOC120410010 n=1 Tax=Corvus cornix cornix TaxID=932674 RepID=UPI00194E4627|nr:uncharacterized protein LOC120410010 [Corvus cornix cornix]
MVVVPSVRGGEVLVVVAMMVVPSVDGAVGLGRAVVAVVVLILTLEVVVGDVGAWVAAVEVSPGAGVGEALVVLPSIVLEVLAVLVAGVGTVVVGGVMVVVPSVRGGEVLVVVAMMVVPSVDGAVGLGRAVVAVVVLILTLEVVVGDVGAWVAAVEVSPGAGVGEALVVLPSVVLEVLAVLVAGVGTVVVGGVMVVVPSVRGGEVLVVVAMMVVPSVDGAVGLGRAVVAVVVLILTLEVVVGDVGAWVAAVEVSPGAGVGEALVVLPSIVLEVLAVLVAGVGTVVVGGVMVVVPSVRGGEVLVVVAMMVVPSVDGAVGLGRAVVAVVVLILTLEVVVGDVGAWVAAVEVSPGAGVGEALVVLPSIVLEVLAVLVAGVGTVVVGGVMVVVPSVRGGEVLVVVAMMVVPSVDGAVGLGRAVVAVVVLILTLEVVVGDVGAWVAAVEVSPGAEVGEALVVLPSPVLEVLAVLVAGVGTDGLGVMVVVPFVVPGCGSVVAAVGVAEGWVATVVVSVWR